MSVGQDHKGTWGTGASGIWGEAERTGTIQPGEEKAPDDFTIKYK